MANESSGEGIGCLFGLVVVCGLFYGAYTGLDSIAFIPHQIETEITAQQNWLVGESKQCFSNPLEHPQARELSKPDGYAVSKISCDDGPTHLIKVTFWAPLEQPDHLWLSWKCTRNSDDFTCKQTGSSPVTLHSHDKSTGKPIVSYDSGQTWNFVNNP